MIKPLCEIRKYTWLAVTSARSNLAYIGEVGSRVIFLGVVLYIFLCLWQVTYKETGSTRLAGLTLPQMLWYLALTESIILSGPRVAAMVDQDVRTGALAVQLIRPLSYPLYCLFTCLGERVVRFVLNLSVGSVIVFLFVGAIPMRINHFLLFLVALPLAFVIDFLGNFLIGLGAFWLEDTSGLVLIYSRVSMILGGMLIPIELFPDRMQPVLKVLPFASIVYGPARLFVAPSLELFQRLVVTQIASVVIFSFAVAIIYGIARRRIFSNGG